MVVRDRVLLGIIAGVIGNIAKDASDTTLNTLGIAKGNYGQLATAPLTGERYKKTRIGLVVGYLADFILAAGLGVPIIYLLSHTGKDYAKIKGAGVGLAEWLLVIGLLGSLTPEGRKVFPLGPQSALASAWHHILYGATTATVATRLGAPELFSRREGQRYAKSLR